MMGKELLKEISDLLAHSGSLFLVNLGNGLGKTEIAIFWVMVWVKPRGDASNLHFMRVPRAPESSNP